MDEDDIARAVKAADLLEPMLDNPAYMLSFTDLVAGLSLVAARKSRASLTASTNEASGSTAHHKLFRLAFDGKLYRSAAQDLIDEETA